VEMGMAVERGTEAVQEGDGAEPRLREGKATVAKAGVIFRETSRAGAGVGGPLLPSGWGECDAVGRGV